MPLDIKTVLSAKIALPLWAFAAAILASFIIGVLL
jgi:hypothetical protein